MNPRPERRGIDGARSMGVELQSSCDGELGVLGLRKMRKFKVGAVQVAQEASRLQVVGSVPGYGAAILEKGEFRQVDVLSREAQRLRKAVIGQALDLAALECKIGAPGQIAQHARRVGLQVQGTGERQALAGDRQQVGHRRVLHLGGGVDGGLSSKASRRRLMRCASS